MPALSEFDLSRTFDRTARLVAADAVQENGDGAAAYILRNVEFAQNGLHARITSGKRAATERKASELLWAGDWVGFASLCRRCKTLKLRMGHNLFVGGKFMELCVVVKCNNRVLAFIRIPGEEPGDKWEGMGARAALALAGLDLDA